MEVRYSPNIETYKKMNTNELRKSFLVDALFTPGEIKMIYSDVDRAVIGSAVPAESKLKLEGSKKELGSEYFAERREIGIINIGPEGSVNADGKVYPMEHKDALYIGRGTKTIEFLSKDTSKPAKFYFVSYPSHNEFPTAHAKFTQAEPAKLGSQKEANKRTIYKYIHANGIKSSQLVMGLTELDEGSIWNTMPVHTHQRRSEIYFYFNLDKDSALFHMMGQPDETRHIIIRNEQAVISPSWSIHAGAATQNYTFIWAMGGENQAFDDMDVVAMSELK
jgi:4-deoxy-L-threo-5-hexosulose-uronate ketol-isomerase